MKKEMKTSPASGQNIREVLKIYSHMGCWQTLKIFTVKGVCEQVRELQPHSDMII